MWPNRSLGLRQELAYELASARLDGGDFDQAEVAFSYLAEISSDAFSDIPSPTSFSAHIVSLAALSRIAVHAERYRDAVEYEVRAVALARRRHLPHYEIPHLGRLADLRARLADIAGADAASIEAVKLCAVLIEEDGEDDESLSIDRVIESVAAIACHSGIRNVVGHFEQDVVALETQSAAASPTRVLDLADALFFLGQARRSIYDLTGAREAYRRSVELREQMPNAFSVATGRTDLTPYAIARLAGFPGEESRWRTLRQWLERRARQRALSEDEQRLLALATARTGNTRR
jgi:tetratricopeptide (TPR) repeat protein